MGKDRDAFGQLVADFAAGRPVYEIVERDDGYISAQEPINYFESFQQWDSVERRLMRFARGRVLDVGCGPGRVAIHLQERGHEVVAIDSSALAVQVARQRGVRDARVLRFEDVDRRLGVFDTVVMMGNNFGLFGGERGAIRMLRRLAAMTSPEARLLVSTSDPTRDRGEHPVHVAYRRRNIERGRMPGQLRLRLRHENIVGVWFDYLLATPAEMSALGGASGCWLVHRTYFGPGSLYSAVLRRTG